MLPMKDDNIPEIKESHLSHSTVRQNLEKITFLICLSALFLNTVNPCDNDSICAQRRCHENEFAVVQTLNEQIDM